MYADPVGSGKTATSLSALTSVNSGRALILAPTYVLDHWTQEGERWCPDIEMILGAGTATKRSRAREKLREVSGPAALVLNYESAWRDVEPLMKLGFDTLICDEAHRLKNRTTSTFKQIAKLARRMPNLLLVTGTPLLNRADEAWSSLHLLWPQRYTSFHAWSAEHFDIEVTDFHGKASRPVRLVKDIKEGHADLIKAEFAEGLLQRTAAEIELELPDVVETIIYVDLSPAERRAYDELEKRAWTRVEGTLIQAPNEVAKITRERQLAAEWGQLTDRGTELGAKVKATIQLAADLDPHHLLIVAQHKATVMRIAEELDAVYVHGDVKPGERNAVLNSFRDGSSTILVATQATLGEGVDGLQRNCHHLIQVDRDWTPGRNDQLVGRLARSGQDQATVYLHRIFAKNTIDTKVDGVLESKTQEITSVTGRTP